MHSDNTDGADPRAAGPRRAEPRGPGDRAGRVAYVAAGREKRHFLLGRSAADRVLFLDDDVWLEPDVIARLMAALDELGCGFVGSFSYALSYVDDVRPNSHRAYEQWRGRPHPERIRPGSPGWNRARLHAAANLLHVTDRLRLRAGEWRAYRAAWVGACVLYDRKRLVAAGGFDFWPQVPAMHCGEDVVAQLRVLERDGGAGIVPSGAYHLESPTTVPDRRINCVDIVLTEAGTEAGTKAEPSTDAEPSTEAGDRPRVEAS